jgi:hypothetical protein
MKKLTILIVAMALVCFTVPAMAVDWNFYGSARMWTSYIADDAKDAFTNPQWDAVDFTTGANVGVKTGDNDDSGVFWDNIGTARVGAKVKNEQIQGRWELNVGGGTRLLWGQWDINDSTSLRIGQDWRPLNWFYSGQLFNDTGMAGPDGAGGVITHRDPQIKLMIGGLQIAGVDPDPVSGRLGEDVDQFMPILEASYHLGLDQFFFDVGGAFLAYDVESATGMGVDDTLTAYVVGLGGGVNFGPAYIKADGWYGQNVSDLGMVTNKLDSGGMAANDDSSAVADGDNFKDTTSWGVLGVIGMKVSDMINLEGGWGYENHENDASGYSEDEAWAAYAQVVIHLAPTVALVPEVGYIDYMDNNQGVDEGNRTYGTIKWQIDF